MATARSSTDGGGSTGRWTPQQILAAISGIESGGNYKIRNRVGTASGKYQYLKSTWNNYGGYAEAYLAPPEVQERRALQDITAKLRAYGGDVRKAIMSWFLPAAVNNPRLASTVPKNNTITPNQYADRVMARLGVKASGATGSANFDSTDPVVKPLKDDPEAPVQDLHDVNQQLANLYTLFTMSADETNEVEEAPVNYERF